MSDFVDVEWFGREQKIGIVLTYDMHDGFKCRMAPLPFGPLEQGIDGPVLVDRSEEADVKWLMANAAKIPFEWAWGIWGKRMKTEWMKRHLANKSWPTVRYDARNYDVKTLEEVKDAAA